MTIKLKKATDATVALLARNGYRITGKTVAGELVIVAKKGGRTCAAR